MKQVIVVNRALAMPPGKLAAQAAHASVAAFLEAGDASRQQWLADGMTKIVLEAATAMELETLHDRALAARIPAGLVHDAGRTSVPAGSTTCLGLGPHEDAELDRLTGSLPLL